MVADGMHNDSTACGYSCGSSSIAGIKLDRDRPDGPSIGASRLIPRKIIRRPATGGSPDHPMRPRADHQPKT
ncbi:hypothetical protein CGZ80_26595 [Rhodopirellula sp. MGV]|nr:hypothetical protein CGZ80_26595 [Rhodopirellula sp. MGV]